MVSEIDSIQVKFKCQKLSVDYKSHVGNDNKLNMEKIPAPTAGCVLL